MCTSAQVSAACTPQAIGQLRVWATDQLTAWFAAPRDLVDDIALIVAELASNAVRAGSSDVVAELTAHARSVRLDILDHADGMPVLTEVDPTAHTGRGLHIVEALTSGWGVDPTSPPPGKTVWTLLDVPQDAAPCFGCRRSA